MVRLGLGPGMRAPPPLFFGSGGGNVDSRGERWWRSGTPPIFCGWRAVGVGNGLGTPPSFFGEAGKWRGGAGCLGPRHRTLEENNISWGEVVRTRV